MTYDCIYDCIYDQRDIVRDISSRRRRFELKLLSIVIIQLLSFFMLVQSQQVYPRSLLRVFMCMFFSLFCLYLSLCLCFLLCYAVNKYLYICRRPCIAKRPSVSVACRIPCTPFNGKTVQRVRAASGESFFQQTIPRRPFSFTIYPNWSSELVVSECPQKRYSLPPRCYMNFSFVY